MDPNDTDWLVDYFVENQDFNDYVANKRETTEKVLRIEKCKLCEKSIAVPIELDEYPGYVCTNCSDDAIHDYVERS